MHTKIYTEIIKFVIQYMILKKVLNCQLENFII